MESRVERAAVRLLREHAVPSLSLRRLHAMVVAEVGPAAGSRARFADDLRRRRDVFVVVEPEDPLGEPSAWPPPLRAEYREAMSAAGIDADPVVVLTQREAQPSDPLGETADESLAAHLGRSLVALLARANGDPGLERALALAMAQTAAFERALRVTADG
jgi:hypothetical protein